jgi:UDP-N-acetyl-D-glucosamine dehydrogenase
VFLPTILENASVTADDIYMCYSPEREDPNNPHYTTSTIPKVIGGVDASSLKVGMDLYGTIIDELVPVKDTATAEAAKLMENIYRCVNIALVNELKGVFSAMDVDIWDVVDAASTKPFGYQKFTPGPGLGGHCIPIDPFYLTWKAKQVGTTSKFIELAGNINTSMPYRVIEQLCAAMPIRRVDVDGPAKVLILGLAYKKNINDTRESPALDIWQYMEDTLGMNVDYHDEYCPEVPKTRKYPKLAGRRSVDLYSLDDYDVVLIVTDHDGVDYEAVADKSKLVVDTRNAIKTQRDNVVKA